MIIISRNPLLPPSTELDKVALKVIAKNGENHPLWNRTAGTVDIKTKQ